MDKMVNVFGDYQWQQKKKEEEEEEGEVNTRESSVADRCELHHVVDMSQLIVDIEMMIVSKKNQEKDKTVNEQIDKLLVWTHLLVVKGQTHV